MEATKNEKKPFHRRYNSHYNNKPKSVTYLKSFNTFEDGYSEVLKFNPELKNYCGDSPIYDAVVSSMMDSIKNNMPSPQNPNYPNTLSLSIDSGEVGFKTDINVAVGWRIAYNYHEAKSFYKFRITFISVPAYKKEVISDMEDAGWSKLDSNYRQSRYWDRVEGKNYKSNKKNFIKKKDNESNEEEVKEDLSTNPKTPEDVKKLNPIPDEIVPEEEDVLGSYKPNVNVTFVDKSTIEEPEEENTNEEVVKEETTTEDTSSDYSSNATDEETTEEKFVMPKTHEEAVKFFAEKDMFHSHQWENPETHKIETITAEEVQKYAGYQNKQVNSIAKASVDGVFVVTHNGVSKVVNMKDENKIPGILIDSENGVIAFPDGVKFSTTELKVIE